MKHTLLLALAASLLALAGCGSDAPATATSATTATPAAAAAGAADWVDADLSAGKAKLPLVVKAPQGYTLSESALNDAEVTSDALTFAVDDVTQLGPHDLATRKAELKSNSGLVFEKFVLEQPDGFIAQMASDNFIPMRVVKVAGKNYLFSVLPLDALPSAAAARQFYDLAGQARAN